MSRTTFILLCQGSPDPRWRAPFDFLRAELLAEGVCDVRIAFLEFCRPSLPEIVEECARGGIERIVVQPMFVRRGRLGVEGFSELRSLIRERHPRLEVDVLPAVGEHPEVFLTISDEMRCCR